MGMSLSDWQNITVGQFFNKVQGYTSNIDAENERMMFKIYADIINNPWIEAKHKPKSFEAWKRKGKSKNSSRQGKEIKTEKELMQWLGKS